MTPVVPDKPRDGPNESMMENGSRKAWTLRGAWRRLVCAAWAALSLSAFTPQAASAGQGHLSLNVGFRGVLIITDLSASSGPGKGQITLTWTVPAYNGSATLTSYDVRASTVSNIETVGEFNAAKPLSAFSSSTLPSPLPSGTIQSFTAGGLTPGVTHYFAIRASDNGVPQAVGGWLRSVPRGFNVYNAAVPPGVEINNFRGRSLFKASELCWDDLLPAQKGPDFIGYRLSRSSFSPPSFAPLVLTTSSCHVDYAVSVGTTYYYRLAGLLGSFDVGTSSDVSVYVRSAPPARPVGFRLHVSTAGSSFAWLPVAHYDFGYSFSVSSAPDSGELTQYQLYQATAPVGAPWTWVASFSSDTRNWRASSLGYDAYFHLKARNVSDVSRPSWIRTAAYAGAIAPLPDDKSTLWMPDEAIGKFYGDGSSAMTAYDVEASSRPEDIGTVSGRVLKSMELTAMRGGLIAEADMALSAMGILRLGFEESGGGVVASGASPSGAGPSAVAPTPENLSVYWNNGTRWVQLYGKLDVLDRAMIIQTKYLGRYQLRATARAGGFNVNAAGLANRMLTPNGDGKNDSVTVVFDNPMDSAVSGRIYDLKGAFVAPMTQGPVANSLLWDGRAGGRVVPGGVYIFQVEAEGRTYNGTIVVVR